MQKVIVRFPEARAVLSSGIPVGVTNEPMVVQDGLHVFSLDGAADYQPAQQRLLVTGSTPSRPFVVTFVQLPALLARWIRPELQDLSAVAPLVGAVRDHFAPLALNWIGAHANGGERAFARLHQDAATGEQWTLVVLERSDIPAHRHNAGGDYGEMIVTLGGSLADVDDASGTFKPVPGPVAFRGSARSHGPKANEFWVGLFHQPRGFILL